MLASLAVPVTGVAVHTAGGIACVWRLSDIVGNHAEVHTSVLETDMCA